MPKINFPDSLKQGPAAVFTSKSAEDTVTFGEKIGRRLEKGMVVALEGPVGAGKTYLAKGIARAAGVKDTVTSPTYTIICEYEGAACPLYHIDTYRLRGEDDFLSLGGAELLAEPGIFIVEWPGKIAALLPASAIRVEIGLRADGRRVFSLVNCPFLTELLE